MRYPYSDILRIPSVPRLLGAAVVGRMPVGMGALAIFLLNFVIDLIYGVVDPRVRALTSGDGARGAAHRALGRSHTAVSTGWDSVKDLAAERAPMATFVVVGAALFVLMFRT